jgi:hypothetical protein
VIQETDRQLKAWIGSVLQGTDVSLGAPARDHAGTGINLYLLQVAAIHAPRGGRKRPPLQLALSYLVTAWSEEPEEAHRLIGELAFAAMDHEEYEVELDSAPLTIWSGFGIAPRPSFLLRARVQRERPQLDEKIVRAQPILHSTVAISVHGVVVGPGNMPLMGARVECPTLNLHTRTDAKGWFRFAALPATPPPVFRVMAKGREQSLTVDIRSLGTEPLLIRFDKWE